MPAASKCCPANCIEATQLSRRIPSSTTCIEKAIYMIYRAHSGVAHKMQEAYASRAMILEVGLQESESLLPPDQPRRGGGAGNQYARDCCPGWPREPFWELAQLATDAVPAETASACRTLARHETGPGPFRACFSRSAQVSNRDS
jgi:hypothetical protein